jgi:hypothetical protein
MLLTGNKSNMRKAQVIFFVFGTERTQKQHIIFITKPVTAIYFF